MKSSTNSRHSTKKDTTRRLSRALTLLSITALALAASPAALAADDRGGPGALSVQQPIPTAFLVVPKVVQRYASWSD
jgi:ABC-type sugar transport system substrate-binding protein